jgi:hypothetical protein
MDVAAILQNSELAFTDRHPGGFRRLPPDFAQGSNCLSERYPRTEPVPSRLVSMGRFSPGHRGFRESAESHRINQISSAQSFHLFAHRHYFILQGPATVGGGSRLWHLAAERIIRTICDYCVFDRRTSTAGIYFFDRCRLFYGGLATDGTRHSGRVSGGSLRRG